MNQERNLEQISKTYTLDSNDITLVKEGLGDLKALFLKSVIGNSDPVKKKELEAKIESIDGLLLNKLK